MKKLCAFWYRKKIKKMKKGKKGKEKKKIKKKIILIKMSI